MNNNQRRRRPCLGNNGSANIRFRVYREDDDRYCASWGNTMLHGIRTPCGSGSGGHAATSDLAVAHALRVLADVLIANATAAAHNR